MRTALIIGSTGLIGTHLVKMLLNHAEYDKVISFVKRDSGLSHPKLEEHIIDFDRLETYESFVYGDDFFCTIGTTIKKAGSQEAFKKVDFEYPKQFAVVAANNKVKQFLIISSLGATEATGNFYLKTKGQIQNFLKNRSFHSVAILQPSLLLGNREEFRLGEKIGAVFSKAISFMLIGKFEKYRPIEAKTVAEAMISIALKNEKDFRIYPSDELAILGNP